MQAEPNTLVSEQEAKSIKNKKPSPALGKMQSSAEGVTKNPATTPEWDGWWSSKMIGELSQELNTVHNFKGSAWGEAEAKVRAVPSQSRANVHRNLCVRCCQTRSCSLTALTLGGPLLCSETPSPPVVGNEDNNGMPTFLSCGARAARAHTSTPCERA